MAMIHSFNFSMTRECFVCTALIKKGLGQLLSNGTATAFSSQSENGP